MSYVVYHLCGCQLRISNINRAKTRRAPRFEHFTNKYGDRIGTCPGCGVGLEGAPRGDFRSFDREDGDIGKQIRIWQRARRKAAQTAAASEVQAEPPRREPEVSTKSPTKTTPRLPFFFKVEAQKGAYKAPGIERFVAIHETPHTVRGRGEAGALQTHNLFGVYALPTGEAWAEVEQTLADLQASYDALAAVLRELGHYPATLAAASADDGKPANPLTATVARAPEPDRGFPPSVEPSALKVERVALARHTPKMLQYDDRQGLVPQEGHFCCPDDGAWERVEACMTRVDAARAAWAALLERLGRYGSAVPEAPLLDLIGPRIEQATLF